MTPNKLNLFFLIFHFITLIFSFVVNTPDSKRIRQVRSVNHSEETPKNNGDATFTLLVSEVNQLKAQFHEFEAEINQKLTWLVNITSMFRHNPEPEQKLLIDSSPSFAHLYEDARQVYPLYTYNSKMDKNPGCETYRNTKIREIDTRQTCVLIYSLPGCSSGATKVETRGRSFVAHLLDDNTFSIGPCTGLDGTEMEIEFKFTQKSNDLIPKAKLYGLPTNSTLHIYNPHEELSPACLTYGGTGVHSIDTFGTCVIMFTRKYCTGIQKQIVSHTRVPIGPEMIDNNHSIGPCYSLASLYTQKQAQGTAYTYDSRSLGNCANLPDEIKSMNTHDTCVQIFAEPNCQGMSSLVKPGTNNHAKIEEQFGRPLKSVGTCSLVLAPTTTTYTFEIFTDESTNDNFVTSTALFNVSEEPRNDQVENVTIPAIPSSVARIEWIQDEKGQSGVFLYNELRLEAPNCENLKFFEEGGILTYESCVILYKEINCQGLNKTFQDSFEGYMWISVDDPKASIGPC